MYIEPGQKISTTIISISKDSVFLDLNAKSEGILPLADIQNEDGTLTAHEGDSIDVYFIGTKDGKSIPYFYIYLDAEPSNVASILDLGLETIYDSL